MNETLPKRLLKSGADRTISGFQWPIRKFVSLILYLGDKKRAFPEGFRKVLCYVLLPIVTGIVAYFGLGVQAKPAWWPQYLVKLGVTYAAVFSFFVSGFTSFIAFLVLRGFLPLLFYAPHAMAMRSMGLQEASILRGGMKTALKKYIKWHDGQKPVRIICISGKNLFGSDGLLFDFAKKGNLHVLFPTSTLNNPTVVARYATYGDNFRNTNYPEVSDLIREMNISKGVIKSNSSNKVYEHDELCMWRVIILSDHCIVQNYFPNHHGEHSDFSPVFVFTRETECPHSYYDTFLHMFCMLSKIPVPQN